ncbi:hypothetical protein [Cryptobacterium curtum]|nr:hypothetical protein [Cryptobacterium curtum]
MDGGSFEGGGWHRGIGFHRIGQSSSMEARTGRTPKMPPKMDTG